MLAALRIDAADSFRRFTERFLASLDAAAFPPFRDGMLGATDVYVQAQRERFASASAGDGTWAEHAPSTVARRGPGAPILHETGDLEASLQRDAPGHYLETTPDAVREGTAHRLAAIHHYGNSSRNLPARPILVAPQPQTLRAMKPPLARAISAAAKEAAAP